MPVANPAVPAERLQLSANVAQWYYIEGLSQEQIGAAGRLIANRSRQVAR